MRDAGTADGAAGGSSSERGWAPALPLLLLRAGTDL